MAGVRKDVLFFIAIVARLILSVNHRVQKAKRYHDISRATVSLCFFISVSMFTYKIPQARYTKIEMFYRFVGRNLFLQKNLPIYKILL